MIKTFLTLIPNLKFSPKKYMHGVIAEISLGVFNSTILHACSMVPRALHTDLQSGSEGDAHICKPLDRSQPKLQFFSQDLRLCLGTCYLFMITLILLILENQCKMEDVGASKRDSKSIQTSRKI